MRSVSEEKFHTFDESLRTISCKTRTSPPLDGMTVTREAPKYFKKSSFSSGVNAAGKCRTRSVEFEEIFAAMLFHSRAPSLYLPSNVCYFLEGRRHGAGVAVSICLAGKSRRIFRASRRASALLGRRNRSSGCPVVREAKRQ